MNDKKSQKQGVGATASAQETSSGVAYDAELRNWSFSDEPNATVAYGNIHEDRKSRWPDGFAIATSMIVDDGGRIEGSIIRTLNTRYLLSGPPGNVSAAATLMQQRLADAWRRRALEQDERLFDLLPAAWGMDDATFEDLAGLSRGWLAQWRINHRSPTSDELAIARRLMSFHQAIGLLMYAQPHYPKWWRRCWGEGSLIGKQTAIEAITADHRVMDRLEQFFRSQF